jgi:aminocarboxymuconate-semialdehyde decarboxylase
VVFTPLQLEMLVRTFGIERIMMGTDFPFDMLEADPIGHVASVDMLDDGARASIAGLTAKKVLSL